MSSSPGVGAPARSERPADRLLDLLAGALRGDASSLARLSQLPPADVCSEAERNGVLPLLAGRFAERRLSDPLEAQLRSRARAHVAADLVREAELRMLVDRLSARGLRALLIKGSQLAYTHYARPDLRPRLDSDLFIATGDRARAHDVLTELAYDRRAQSDGDLLMYQAPYTKERQGVVVHVVDLHWRLVNPQRFGRVLDYAEAAAEAVEIPSLGGALGLSRVHALLLACVHRVAHHYGSDSLIWLHDLHLLAETMSPSDWSRFMRLATDREVGAICRQGLSLARDRFGTTIPAALFETDAPASAAREKSEIYMTRQRHVMRVYSDLQALPGWIERWRLVRQHLFPPAMYMRTVYAPASHAPLPLLYAVRALRGARKWIVRQ